MNKRKLIGRVDNVETKEIVPTDGRGKKRSPYLSEAERETLKADESAEFMQNLFTEKDTPVETQCFHMPVSRTEIMKGSGSSMRWIG